VPLEPRKTGICPSTRNFRYADVDRQRHAPTPSTICDDPSDDSAFPAVAGGAAHPGATGPTASFPRVRVPLRRVVNRPLAGLGALTGRGPGTCRRRPAAPRQPGRRRCTAIDRPIESATGPPCTARPGRERDRRAMHSRPAPSARGRRQSCSEQPSLRHLIVEQMQPPLGLPKLGCQADTSGAYDCHHRRSEQISPNFSQPRNSCRWSKSDAIAVDLIRKVLHHACDDRSCRATIAGDSSELGKCVAVQLDLLGLPKV
jgi:hypothetical protein